MIHLQGNVQGKVALVTGSTSGIGLAIAQGLADAGVHIALNGFGEADKIDRLVCDIEGRGVHCIYCDADMTQPREIAEMVDDVISQLGSIDILVNNAGIQNVAPIEDFDAVKWDAIMAINLSSSFHTVQHVLPHMRERGWGRIINMGSAHSLVASPCKSAYVAAKHGILGLSKTVALEAAQDGVTCNVICPGYVRTPLVEGQIADTARARGISEDEVVRDVMLSAQWTKQFVETDQLAGCVLFLCSDAAANITGTSLSVDGGWTAA